jgi:DNA-binding response OmpR family regulator
MNILIVEDEKRLADALSHILVENKYMVDVVYDGADGLAYGESGIYDCIILDVMLPTMNGFDVCLELRKKKITTTVLMLTAKDTVQDKVRGLDAGADDYMTKPYSMAVLYAKITALINRSRGSVRTTDSLTVGAIRLDLRSQRVFVAGEEITLTPKEYALLLCMTRNRGMVLSREQLLVKCWGYDYEGDSRSVDTYIRRLRQKLGTAAEQIRKVIKSGYKLEG